jgi:TorA maturation chaperone TorD
MFLDTGESDYKKNVDDLLNTARASFKAEDGANFLDGLSNDFTRLFVGPGKMEADPWESLHLSKENVLFQAVTLEVRRSYVASGFIPQSYPNVADDHIALELDFMAALANRAQDAYQEADIEKTRIALVASRDFLDEHLLVWVPSFAERLARAKHSQFYGKAGAVLNVFLPIDRLLVDELEMSLR